MNRRTKRNERKLKKVYLSNFDRLYTSCRNICNLYETRQIPLNLLKENIGRAKFKIEYKNKYIDNLSIAHNKVLDKIYVIAQQTCKKMNVKSLPLAELEGMIKTIKESFKEGFEGK